MAIFLVVTDVLALFVALGLIALSVIKTHKSLARYFVLPVVLLCIHVYGNTVQELGLGPEWIRNHLHNAGVAGVSLVPASLINLWYAKKDRKAGYSEKEIVSTSLNWVLAGWLLGSALGIIQEVLSLQAWGESLRRAGYSGELDWFDLSAYVAGALIVTLNHIRYKPRVLAALER